MTHDDAPRYCFASCGLPGDYCACYRHEELQRRIDAMRAASPDGVPIHDSAEAALDDAMRTIGRLLDQRRERDAENARLWERERAYSDLLHAARGHLSGGDWDKEMQEAVWQIDCAALAPPTTDDDARKLPPCPRCAGHQGWRYTVWQQSASGRDGGTTNSGTTTAEMFCPACDMPGAFPDPQSDDDGA